MKKRLTFFLLCTAFVCMLLSVTALAADDDTPAEQFHTFGAWEDANDGIYHTRTCLDEGCGEIERAEHNWGDPVAVSSGITLGEKAAVYFCYSCPDCGATKQVKLNLSQYVDCGSEVYHLCVCADEGIDYSMREEHTWDDGVLLSAECGENMVTLYTCVDCGATQKRYSVTEEDTDNAEGEESAPDAASGSDAAQAGGQTVPTSPKTGDGSLILWIVLTALSGGAALGVLLLLIRSKKRN